jgi:hypothetical protein
MGIQRHVWFTPDSDRIADIVGGPFRANKRHLRCDCDPKARALFGQPGSTEGLIQLLQIFRSLEHAWC